MSDLLIFVISNSNKHEFSSIWRWISCCNDVMNHGDYVIKCDVYPQKKHSYSKNIYGISILVLKISVVYQEKYIICVIASVFRLLKDKKEYTSKHR